MNKACLIPPTEPLISIITTVFNGAAYLEQAILSVISQDYRNIEYIIIDGGSTDGTLDIIRKYQDNIGYWLSERDRGIYDAMNKGISHAKGEWFYFLGADDALRTPQTLACLMPYLTDDHDLVCGGVCYPDGRVEWPKLSPRTLIHNTIHHQGAFYNRRLFEHWRYDSELSAVADYELNLIIYLKNMKTIMLRELIAFCRDGGVSRNNFNVMSSEINIIRKRHVGPAADFVLRTIFFLELGLYKLVYKVNTKQC